MLAPDEVERVGQALLSELSELSIPQMRIAIAKAGLDATSIPATSEERGGAGSRAEVVPAMFKAWSRLTIEAKERALPILGERLMNNSERGKRVAHLLVQHGFRFEQGVFVPTNLLDERERDFLPRSSYDETVKAFKRLSEGDESGALTSACGAVDSLMQRLYAKYPTWGAPPVSFQAKVNTALKQLAIFEGLCADLVSLGIRPEDANAIVDDLREATKRATNGLQVLRRAMGDVHGTKPALRKMIYDAVKWSSAICALFAGYDS
jgi:hypothetical protein